ncbi:hypothetical protein [Clostridium botulinum]|uniref:hypothetical protein n=1 Tax=Clostridium botulinum TaxID=1491 RepID=UPI001967159E|nr:hypothetical protein [Clostridium botulinum]MBY6835993.1 hypothetical protein [Clostridium botulinum]MBY6929788.1 hypothetical protein [Clostridium botulinum]
MNKYYVAKTLRMMNFLAKKFDCVKVSDDLKNKSYKVFLFQDSDDLREYLKSYNN